MKVLSTEGLTKLIDLIKSSFISNEDTQATIAVDAVETSEVTLATVATTGAYSDLSGTPTVDQTYDGTSANAQSGVAVASAISGKADDSAVVHLAGTETITGQKTFSSVAYGTASDANGSIVTTVNKTKLADGYFKFGNGMIVQWGYVAFSSQAADVSFPVAFSGESTYRFVALRRAGSSNTSDGGQIFARNRTSTTINLYASSANTASCDWIAIGF